MKRFEEFLEVTILKIKALISTDTETLNKVFSQRSAPFHPNLNLIEICEENRKSNELERDKFLL